MMGKSKTAMGGPGGQSKMSMPGAGGSRMKKGNPSHM